MEEYLQRKAERAQNYLVNARMPMSLGPSIYFWTHRVTSTDVISLVTTSMAISEEGYDTMGLDIDKEKDLVLTKTESNTGGPLRKGAKHDEVEHQRKCEELWAERDAFLKRLSEKRSARIELEMGAAIRLQAYFRGFLARQQVPYLIMRLEVRQKVWASLRDTLIRTGWETSKTKYLARRQQKWHAAALTLQLAYRRALAIRALRRKHHQQREDQKLLAIKSIQNWVRAYFSKHYAKRERSRKFYEVQESSAKVIQCCWRRFAAWRSVGSRRLLFRMVCALAVQCAWRRYLGAKRANEIKEKQRFEAETRAVTKVQQRIRGILGRARFAHLVEIAEINEKFGAVVKIQRQIRRYQAIKKARSVRFRRAMAFRLGGALQLQRIFRGYAARKRVNTIKDIQQIDIFEQAKQDNHSMVTILITQFDDDNKVEDRDPRGYTALMVAALHGKIETVRKCLALGWSANVTMQDGETTAAHLASEKGHSEVVQYMVQRGGLDLTVHGVSLVMIAARKGLEKILQVFISMDRNLVLNARYKGGSVLHQAVYSGSKEVIHLIMNELGELDIDAQDENGRTALHVAVTLPSKEVVQVLLNASARLRLKDSHGFVPAVVAGLYGTEEVANLMIRSWYEPEEMQVKQWVHDEDIAAVIKIAGGGRSGMLEKAFEIGFPPSTVHWETGDSIAIAACRSGNMTCAKLCIKVGCDFKHKNNAGVSAVHEAANTTEILSLLLSNSVISSEDLLQRDNNGVTPLMIFSGQGGALDLLTNLEADQVNIKDNNGLTAFHYAAKNFKIDAIKSLLGMGASASELDNRFQSALHHCAASMPAKNNYLTAMDYAEMVQVLREAGASLTSLDDEDATPPLVALEEGSWKLLEAMSAKLQHKDAQSFAFKCIEYNSKQGLMALLKFCEEYKIHEWRNEDHLSLIGAAVKEDHVKIVRYLLEEREAPFSPSLLHLAAYHGCVDVLCFFQEIGKLELKLLEKRVQGFADIHFEPNCEGDTVFMAALRGCQIDTAWWLWKEFHCKVKPALSFHCSGWIIAQARCETSSNEKHQSSTLSPFNLHEDSVSIVYFQNLAIDQ